MPRRKTAPTKKAAPRRKAAPKVKAVLPAPDVKQPRRAPAQVDVNAPTMRRGIPLCFGDFKQIESDPLYMSDFDQGIIMRARAFQQRFPEFITIDLPNQIVWIEAEDESTFNQLYRGLLSGDRSGLNRKD